MSDKDTTWETEPPPEFPPSKKVRYNQRWQNWQPCQTDNTSPSCVLFIARFPRQTTPEDILQSLQSLDPALPPPLNIRISYNYNKKSNRYAFVTWPNEDCVKTIIEIGAKVGEENNLRGAYMKIGERWALLDYERGRSDSNFQEAKKNKKLNDLFMGIFTNE